MKIRFIFLILVALSLMTNCKENRSQVYNEMVPSSSDPTGVTKEKQNDDIISGNENKSVADNNEYETKVIKTGNILVTSKDIEEAKTIIYKFVIKCKGNIVNENLISQEPLSYYDIQLNIRADLFDQFFKLIDSSGLNIISKSFNSTDVTLDYVDNKTRLENKKKLEQSYLNLLSKAKDIKSILEIEEKLESVREDIESGESQMKVMEKQISYSSVTLRIEKQDINLTYKEKSKYWYRIWRAIIDGWSGIKTLLILIITIWPIYAIIIGVYFLIRFLRRRKRI